MHRIFSILKISPKLFILKQCKCIFLILANALSSLCFPLLLGKIIDQGTEGIKDIKRVAIYIVALIVSGLLMAIFQYLQSVSIFRLQQEFSVKIKEKVYLKCINGNWKFWSQWKAGDILRILGEDIAQLENTITIIFGQLLVHIFLIIGISTLLFYYDWSIGLLSLLLCIVLSFTQKRIGKKIQSDSFSLRENVEENASYTNETLNNTVQYTMAGLGNNLSRKFMAQTIFLSQKAISLAKLTALSRYVGMMYNVIVVSIALIIGIMRINGNQLSIGELYTITIFVQRLYSPIIGLGDSYISIKKTIPVVNRVIRLLDSEDVVERGNVILEKNISNIQFCNVGFFYDKKRSLLIDTSLNICKGQIIGILGENGIGKSTIIRLLTKICKCTSGKITINDIDINDIDTDYLHEHISVMNQEGNLLSGTVRSIVNPFDINIDDEKIYSILKCIAFDINKLSNGLDTRITPNISNLSGGERQKLNLARIIIEDKPVAILDEPTSSLDLESENTICSYLQETLRDKIAIIITHRENILRICTQVIRF